MCRQYLLRVAESRVTRGGLVDVMAERYAANGFSTVTP